MKIKKWLISSYLIIILVPIITALFIYKGIDHCNKKVEFNNYINTINKAEFYEKKLKDPKLYKKVQKNTSLLEEEDKTSVQINLYDNNGFTMYSSLNTVGGAFPLNSEQLYSNLYNLQVGYRANTIKKPVLVNGDIIGFYEIIVARENLIKEVNKVAIVSFILFVSVVSLVFIVAIYFLNKKIIKPVKMIIRSMNSYAKGEDNTIPKYNKKDEIGELINHFIIMKEEIEKQKKDKEYLIAAISHDLKTPLTSIRAYGEAIREHEDLNKEDLNKYSSIIINKSDYMKTMLDELFTYTILNTKYDLDKVQVDGEEFIDMLFDGYNELCEKQGVNLIKDIKVNSNLEVDVNSIIRIVDNLVNNALRYVTTGESICLGAYSTDVSLPSWLGEDVIEELNSRRKEYTMIFVKNHGEPIKKEEQDKIFKAFYQSDDSRNKENNSGTGLGLSIVKLIIEKHGGHVDIVSKDNFGTLIACFLPEDF